MNRTGIIYMYENSSNGKAYIGQTVHPEKRKREHKRADSNSKFHKAIKSYGYEHFDYSALHENAPEKKLDSLEKYYIFAYNSYKNGYNLTEGGDSVPAKNPEVAAKISKAIQKQVEDGIHHFVINNPNKKRMEDGTHHFLTNNPNKKRMEDGTHHFLTNNPSKKQIEDGKNVFFTDNPSKKPENRKAASKRMRKRNFENNPNDDPILLNKAQRGGAKTRRKKKEELGQTYLFSDILEQEEQNGNINRTKPLSWNE